MKKQDFINMCKDAIQKTSKQGKPSIRVLHEDGVYKDCAYKSDIGCCIVGHMMNNDDEREKADELFEHGGSTVRDVINKKVWGHDKKFNNKQINILTELQNIHDQYFDIEFDEKFEINCNKLISEYEK